MRERVISGVCTASGTIKREAIRQRVLAARSTCNLRCWWHMFQRCRCEGDEGAPRLPASLTSRACVALALSAVPLRSSCLCVPSRRQRSFNLNGRECLRASRFH